MGQNDAARRVVTSGLIPQQQIRFVEEPRSIPVHARAGCAAPQVQLIQQNGQIQAIDIVCTCGERIRLRCVYS